MHTVSLAWGHYFDSEIFIAAPTGITLRELRHYARGVGFIDFQTHTGAPLLCGYSEHQKAALKEALQNDGYSLGKDGLFSAMPIFLCVPDTAEALL
ncbi:hypothetical protein [Endobacterium cereale]|uniref:hypothetical protein n=1 Tax=Endobacterium cereale TaxID=2663029 RepID=UPI002B48B578|nr:hypothetical protein [Endobacterium cereale]MEB2846810.1 hypothetical protein [Endobacterium cereale]